jgi:stringent starvation protein B
MSMTSHRSYLVKALNEWILDNNCTPYILVNAYEKGVEVPQNFVKDGQIVLNISPIAVQALLISHEGVEFHGRFGGIPTRVYVPTEAIMGIYAKENGQGMIFEYGAEKPDPPGVSGPDQEPGVPGDIKKTERPTGSRPSLRVVK